MIEVQKNYKLTLTDQQAKELYWILKDVLRELTDIFSNNKLSYKYLEFDLSK